MNFLNNVVSSTIAFDADGKVRNYVGGYDDWVTQRPKEELEKAAEKPKKENLKKPRKQTKRKLTYKETRDLEELPAKIEALETEQGELHERVADPSFYQQDHTLVTEVTERLKTIEEELETCYTRWDELESLAS